MGELRVKRLRGGWSVFQPNIQILGLLLLCLPLVGYGQDQHLLLLRQVQDLTREGVQAMSEDDLVSAENSLGKAVTLARRLQPSDWLTRAEALKHLANAYHGLERPSDGEELLSERLDVVRRSVPLDPEFGNALFDLQSAFTANGKLDDAFKVASEGVEYWEGPCADSLASSRCDRRLADVQGLMGCGYFLADRYDEAEPWLKKVVDRPDDGVRPETMVASLRAYAQIEFARLNMLSAATLQRRALRVEESHREAEEGLDGR